MKIKKVLKRIKRIISNIFRIEEIIQYTLKKEVYEIKSRENKNICLDTEQDNNIIISLTTYGKRIYEVHIVIQTLFEQTKKPSKIILWLSEDEFSDENIPIILKNMQNYGLEIRYCEDLKSYKKILPSLNLYPNSFIVTVDDDILYPIDFLENLWKTYRKNPKSVICYRAHRVTFNKNGKMNSYSDWEHEITNVYDKNLFLTSGGGTLFFPGCFPKEFYNRNVIFKTCPTSDDVWINYMLRKNFVNIKLVEDPRKWRDSFFINKDHQDTALFKINVIKKKNDIQMKNLEKTFGIKFKKLLNENNNVNQNNNKI